MGVKVIYEPKIGQYIVQEFVLDPTLGDAEAGYWTDMLALHSVHPARDIVNALQGSRPVPLYRVIERDTDETE